MNFWTWFSTDRIFGFGFQDLDSQSEATISCCFNQRSTIRDMKYGSGLLVSGFAAMSKNLVVKVCRFLRVWISITVFADTKMHRNAAWFQAN
jgi:hypothetical protein